MKKFSFKFTAAALVAAAAMSAHSQAAAVVASDDYQGYSSLAYGDNGGTGLGALTYQNGSGGNVYLETGGGAAIDGGKSMGIYASTGGQAATRSITSGPNVIGTYDVSARFNLSNTVSFSGFNIKSAQGSNFADNQLVQFGLDTTTGNNSIVVYGGDGTKTINLGSELRGAVLDFHLAFDTSLATYTLTATKRGGNSGSVSGSLYDTNGLAAGTGSVTNLGFANYNSDNAGNQNLIVDNIQVVPEPSSVAMLIGSSLFGCVYLVRRRRA